MIEVAVDAAQLTRGMRELERELPRVAREGGRTQSARTADVIRGRVPVLTGALRSTVAPRTIASGGSVAYGGNLRYAGVIEARTHTVRDAITEGEREYEREMRAALDEVIAKL